MSNSEYTATIGLEVHAELKTKSKMFCGCVNDPHHSEPNANVCPVCLAHPGTLPVPNEEAIKKVLLFGQAVQSSRASETEFDRKNYFYPDIPKAYQISQYERPFLSGGSLAGVALTRVHLEEDTARSQHDQAGVSLVDFNRAGVPLMELVTEPVIHDAETAGRFARELQLLLQTIDISDAQMEKGEMRVEANISVSKTDELGTKVEVKNLNSFKSVESAIDYEIKRQVAVLEDGDEVKQETRGWDEVKLKTFTQRSKESAKDYRYFNDPDIPKMDISEHGAFDVSRLAEILPMLPEKRREIYNYLGLTSQQGEILLANKVLGQFFAKLQDHLDKESNQNELLKISANYLTSDVVAEINLEEVTELKFSVENFAKLMQMVVGNEINSRVAKDLIKELVLQDFDPEAIATTRGLKQTSDPSALLPVIDEIIAEFSSVVEEYKGGKDSSIQFLVGQGMKKTRGTANPELLRNLLVEKLK